MRAGGPLVPLGRLPGGWPLAPLAVMLWVWVLTLVRLRRR
jgi:hypothetical protein